MIATSKTTDGYIKIGGIIIQWGVAGGTNWQKAIKFPVPFPIQCCSVVCSSQYPGASGKGYNNVTNISKTGCTLIIDNAPGCWLLDINSKLADIVNVVIVAGSVNTNGNATLYKGSFSSYRIQSGKYRITHNLGTTNYSIVFAANGDYSRNYAVFSKTSEYFEVVTFHDTKWDDASFYFTIIGF